MIWCSLALCTADVNEVKGTSEPDSPRSNNINRREARPRPSILQRSTDKMGSFWQLVACMVDINIEMVSVTELPAILICHAAS